MRAAVAATSGALHRSDTWDQESAAPGRDRRGRRAVVGVGVGELAVSRHGTHPCRADESTLAIAAAPGLPMDGAVVGAR